MTTPPTSAIAAGTTLMKICVPKEMASNERRVALVPGAVTAVIKTGADVLVETGAGQSALFTDTDYEKTGAKIVGTAAALYAQADIVVKIQKPSEAEVTMLRAGAVLIALLQPPTNPELVKQLADRKVTAFSMDAIPRITRAQSMDVLSSQATVAGYKAVILAANAFSELFPMLTTAAGTIPPAKVLVIGAGVAGLQAIATARRLGAVVFSFDVRAAVKEQVESLGAKFLQVELADRQTEDKGGYAKELSRESHQRELDLIANHVKDMDVVITTAAIPGKRAPLLVTKEMVATMRAGAVIMDLAAESGGNCELTEAGKEVRANGVTIHGPVNLASTMPKHASQMYARNVTELLKLLVKKGALNLDFNDEIIQGTCITHDGAVRKG